MTSNFTLTPWRGLTLYETPEFTPTLYKRHLTLHSLCMRHLNFLPPCTKRHLTLHSPCGGVSHCMRHLTLHSPCGGVGVGVEDVGHQDHRTLHHQGTTPARNSRGPLTALRPAHGLTVIKQCHEAQNLKNSKFL